MADDFDVIGKIVVDGGGAASLTSVNGQLESMQSNAGNLGGVFSGLGDIANFVFAQVIVQAASAALNAVKQFIGDSIDLAEKQQDAVAQFENQFSKYAKNIKGSVGGVHDSLMSLAAAMAETTKFSETQVIAGETVLLQFGKIGKDVLPQAVKLTADLATEMRTDFPSAAALMGKALGDPVMGIGRVNQALKLFEPVQLKAIENMAKHGQIAKAQEMIMAALSDKIGGAAAAAAKDFAGKMAILNDEFDMTKIEIGNALLPSLSNLIDKFKPLIDAILPVLVDIIDNKVIPAFSGLMSGISGLADWLMNSKSPIDDIGTALQNAFSIPNIDQTVKSLMAGLPSIILAGRNIVNGLLISFVRGLPDMMRMGGEFLTSIVSGLMDLLPLILDSGTHILGHLVNGFVDALPMLILLGRNIINSLVQSLIQGIPAILQFGKDLIGILGNAITGLFNNLPNLIDAGKNIVNNLVAGLKAQLPQIKSIGGPIGDVFGGIINLVTDLAPQIADFIGNQLSAFSGWFTENGPLIQKFINTISEGFNKYIVPAIKAAWAFIAPILSGIFTLIGQIAKLIMQVATGDWSDAWNTIKSIAFNVVGTLVGGIFNLLSGMASIFGSSLSGVATTAQQLVAIVLGIISSVGTTAGQLIGIVGGIISGFIQKGKDMIQNIIDGINAKIQGAKDAISGVIENIKSTITAKAADLILKGNDIITNIKTGIGATVSIIEAAITGVVASIVTTITSKASDLIAKGTDIVSSIGTGITNGVNWTTDAITSTVASIISTIANKASDIISSGTNIVTNIATGIANNVSAVTTEAGTAVSGWITDFTNDIAAFVSMGKNIIDSIVTGISNSAGAVKDKLMGIVNDAINAIKKALGIASPSKVFLEIGANIPQGMALGIEAMAHLPVDALAGLVPDLTAAASTNYSNVANSSNSNNYNSNVQNSYSYNFGMTLYGQQQSPTQDLTQAFRKA